MTGAASLMHFCIFFFTIQIQNIILNIQWSRDKNSSCLNVRIYPVQSGLSLQYIFYYFQCDFYSLDETVFIFSGVFF